jgi:hypothetical protein
VGEWPNEKPNGQDVLTKAIMLIDLNELLKIVKCMELVRIIMLMGEYHKGI